MGLVERKDGVDRGFLFRIYFQGSPIRLVTQRHASTHLQPLALGCCNLVPNPFGCHLALELRERQQDVEREPAHAGPRIEALRNGHERRFGRIEPVDQPSKICQGTGQTVDLLDHDLINLFVVYVLHEVVQRRSIKMAA